MSPLTAAHRLTPKRALEVAAYLGRRLVKNPREVVDLLGMYGALISDRWAPTRAHYVTVGWLAALVEMAGSPERAMEVSEEVALREVELEVAEAKRRLSHRAPWAHSFDADQRLATFLYAACRLLKPETVIETGVSYGVSTAFLLKALSVNNKGILHSIDLPSPGWQVDDHVGVLVAQNLRARWQFHRGTSRRLLPGLLAEPVDLFVHDSLHTYRNMRFEFEQVWPHLQSGGVLIADDIGGNDAFAELVGRTDVDSWRVVAESDKPASFGFAVKSSQSVSVVVPST